MSRRFPRTKANFAVTVLVGGVDHTLVCRTRDVSADGCFLETSENIAAGVQVRLAAMDNDRGEVVSGEGRVARVSSPPERGVGVHLHNAPEEWNLLVERIHQNKPMDPERPRVRLKIVVVSKEGNRRGALALYVTSGWDIRFAVDARTAKEAFDDGVALDAVICELDADDHTWPDILRAAREKQPTARRLVRCVTEDRVLPASGNTELVHRFVEVENGLDSLLDALTAEMGEFRQRETCGLSVCTEGTSEILRDVLERSSTSSAIAVFDLDATLLDPAPRQSAILRDFGKKADISAFRDSKPEHWRRGSVVEAMMSCGLSAEAANQHREAFAQYWKERVFTDEYCALDGMVPGASGFVQAVKKRGGKVCYVTGRHEEMREVSIRCLARLGFPVPDNSDVQLLMKPTLAGSEGEHKMKTSERLVREGTVIAAFDNEPAHINGYHKAFPDAFSVHLATIHSGCKVKVLDGIVSILDFASR